MIRFILIALALAPLLGWLAATGICLAGAAQLADWFLFAGESLVALAGCGLVVPPVWWIARRKRACTVISPVCVSAGKLASTTAEVCTINTPGS